jgi:hypothetical protein
MLILRVCGGPVIVIWPMSCMGRLTDRLCYDGNGRRAAVIYVHSAPV